MTQETLREAGSKALCRRLTSCSGFCHSLRCRDAIENFGDAMDAAIVLMQPEIDRRVAEEKARLLEALRVPSGREFDDMPKNRVQYREWAAIGKCEYNDATQEEAFDAVDAAIATMFERLRDPATVHVNMLRGGIAKPSPTNIWHIYGRELLADMPKEYAAEEKAKLFERLRTPSEGMIEAGKAIGRYEGHHVYCRHIEDDTVPCVCGYLAAHNSLRDAIDKFQQENSDG